MSAPKRRLNIDTLTPAQQGLLAAVLMAIALLIGSILFLSFAVPNNWLVPTPRNQFERDIIVAQDEVREAERTYGTGPTEEGRTPYADASALLLEARLNAKQFNRALKDARALSEQFPDHAQITLMYARALFETEHFSDAQQVISELLDRTQLPTDIARDAYYMQAQLSLNEGEHSDAFESLIRAAQIPPASTQYYEEAGNLAVSLRRWEDAANAYGWALAFNPDSRAAQVALSEIRSKDPEAFAHGIEEPSMQTGINIEGLLP
ncbi:MAG: tetratricopeptide repeat protein [Coriobacteriia bacterium]|nr:tetratricopeptide repeat protein [Coriobacteriia bacterium]